MHVLGHVFIWLIALGALAAAVLSAKTYDVRNSWIKKIDQLKEETEKNKPIIAEKEARLKELQAELSRVILGWGRPFVNVNGQLIENTFQFNTQDPQLTGWLGSLDQAQQASQVVYVFIPQPDGNSIYVGSFQLAAAVPAGGGDAVFNPTWTVRASDYESIPPESVNGPFRVRPMVPARFPSKYADIRGNMSITERLLADKQDDLAEQKLREADAKSILQQRTDQLKGANGIVSQLQTSEDARNLELEEEDHWRREVDKARQEVERLFKDNRDLEKQLKQPPSSNPPSVTAQVTRR